MTRVVVLGATSAIACATATRLARRDGTRFVLVARDAAGLGETAATLRAEGADVADTVVADLRERSAHAALIGGARAVLGGLDVAIIAHGLLPDQARCEADAEIAMDAIDANFLSAASLLLQCATVMEDQRHGSIVVIGSVAGDRGRQSNYIYGSAKAGLHVFAQGLRNRLHCAGVHVLTVKPGLVDTPMTAHLPKNRLFAQPDTVAASIERALRKRRSVVYTPGFWRWAMLLIRAIPEPLFKRLSL